MNYSQIHFVLHFKITTNISLTGISLSNIIFSSFAIQLFIFTMNVPVQSGRRGGGRVLLHKNPNPWSRNCSALSWLTSSCAFFCFSIVDWSEVCTILLNGLDGSMNMSNANSPCTSCVSASPSVWPGESSSRLAWPDPKPLSSDWVLYCGLGSLLSRAKRSFNSEGPGGVSFTGVFFFAFFFLPAGDVLAFDAFTNSILI